MHTDACMHTHTHAHGRMGGTLCSSRPLETKSCSSLRGLTSQRKTRGNMANRRARVCRDISGTRLEEQSPEAGLQDTGSEAGVAETEPGAVGQRGEDSRGGRQLVVAAHGWWAVLGSRRPGGRQCPGRLELPMQQGLTESGLGLGPPSQSPSLRSTLLGCSLPADPGARGHAWLSFSWAASAAAPNLHGPTSQLGPHSVFHLYAAGTSDPHLPGHHSHAGTSGRL